MANGMVFCRGCGKEIHNTAPMCPMCGAPQAPSFRASAPAMPTHAYAAPASAPKPRIDYASRQDISDSWKRKFDLIEKAGGPKLPNFKSLSFGERMQVGFSVLALFLGPIYYLVKGLWRQAVAYSGIGFVLTVILAAARLDGLQQFVVYGIAGLYAARANVSYYKKEVFGEISWL